MLTIKRKSDKSFEKIALGAQKKVFLHCTLQQTASSNNFKMGRTNRTTVSYVLVETDPVKPNIG